MPGAGRLSAVTEASVWAVKAALAFSISNESS